LGLLLARLSGLPAGEHGRCTYPRSLLPRGRANAGCSDSLLPFSKRRKLRVCGGAPQPVVRGRMHMIMSPSAIAKGFLAAICRIASPAHPHAEHPRTRPGSGALIPLMSLMIFVRIPYRWGRAVLVRDKIRPRGVQQIPRKLDRAQSLMIRIPECDRQGASLRRAREPFIGAIIHFGAAPYLCREAVFIFPN
jgi:hypothetical protein